MITKELLRQAGWLEKSGWMVLKGYPIRFGWKDGRMIVGWTEWPALIIEKWELSQLLRLAGLEKEANKF